MLTSSNREAVIKRRDNTASNKQRHSGGSMQTVPQPPNNGVPSNLRQGFVVRKPSAEPNQQSNRGTTVRTNPKVQEKASGYSKPWLLSHQQANTRQSAVRNPLTPAKKPALYGQTASQSGLGARSRTSATVRATRLSSRRGSKVSRPGQTKQFGTNKYRTSSNYSSRRGTAQTSSRGTLVARSFYDPFDPRYKQTINYVIPSAYGSVIIKRLSKRPPQQKKALPQRRDPPKRQSQGVRTQRTHSWWSKESLSVTFTLFLCWLLMCSFFL